MDSTSTPRLPLVELIASVRGFYQGRMIEPGEAFMFDPNPRAPGFATKFPQWAAPRGEKAVKQPSRFDEVDIKPADAAKAAERKARSLSGW